MKIKALLLYSFLSLTYASLGAFVVEESPSNKKKSKQYNQFFKACLHQAKGEHKKAHDLYKTMFLNQTPQACNKAYIKLLFDSQNFPAVITLTEKKYKKDLDIQLLRAQAFLMQGNDKAAEPILKRLVEKKSHDLMITYQYSVSLLRQQKTSDALTILEQFFDNNESNPQHAILYFIQAKIFLSQNDSEKALKAIDQAITLHPRFDQGILFKSMLLQQMGNAQGAIASFQEYLNLVNNPEIEQQLLNLLIRQKDFVALEKQIKKSNITNADFFYRLGTLFVSLQEKKTAKAAFKKAYKLNPHENKYWLAHLDLIKTKELTSKIKKLLTRWTTQSANRSGLVQTCEELKTSLFTPDELISFLEELHTKKISTPETLAYLTDLYFEKKAYKEGIALTEKILTFPLSVELQADTLFNKAYGQWMLNDKVNATKTLQNTLERNPLHAEAANLLALAYVEENAHLDQAERLIEKALEQSPNNEAFVKTKEMVILKKTKNTEKQFVYGRSSTPCPLKKKQPLL